MRGLIILCLCAVGLAAPQGYNYNQGVLPVQQPAPGGFIGGFGVASNTAGSNFLTNGQTVQHANFGIQQQVQQQQVQQQQVQQQQVHQEQVLHQQQVQHQHQQEAIVSKRFFIHSAPEDVEEDYKEKHITVGVPKKNYNVVFIKSPAKSHKKTAIKISPAPNEEKTVIYVLSKKTDASDIQAEVVEHATTTAKPEVFFIKYKTNEEANHAQEQIQAQYDALGGSSQVTDEGVAPVTSVIGSLGGGDAGINGNASNIVNNSVSGTHGSGSVSFGNNQAASSNFGTVQTGAISGAAINNAYLPPNFY